MLLSASPHSGSWRDPPQEDLRYRTATTNPRGGGHMLETIWFLLWGILWAVYFMLGGFDLGAGTLAPFVARTDKERRKISGSIGPFWNGNEVWLITAGGVTFAAFPAAYAALFSALYSPLMILLFALILRAVSIE